MSGVVDAVAGRRRAWVDAVNAGSLERYAELLAEDAVWLPPSGPPVVGRDGFRRWLEPFFGRFEYRFSLEPTRVIPFDGWCAERGRFRSALTEKGSDTPQVHGGDYFVLWRLDGDGVWRIERYVDVSGGG